MSLKEKNIDLINYCNKAIELESQIFSTEASINNLEKAKNPANYRNRDNNQRIHDKYVNSGYNYLQEDIKSKKLIIFGFGVFIFCAFFLVFGSSVLGFISALIFACVVSFIIYANYSNKKLKEYEETKNSRELSYTQYLNNSEDEKFINEVNDWSNTYYEKQLKEYDSLLLEKNKMKDSLSKLYEMKDKFYSDDVIYAKYRNLAALSTIKEYLESERCYELTGPDGAYNKYDLEEQNNRIITKLDQLVDKSGEILQSLQDIKGNQFVLYTALTEINNNIIKVGGELDYHSALLQSIDKNANLAQFHTSWWYR